MRFNAAVIGPSRWGRQLCRSLLAWSLLCRSLLCRSLLCWSLLAWSLLPTLSHAAESVSVPGVTPVSPSTSSTAPDVRASRVHPDGTVVVTRIQPSPAGARLTPAGSEQSRALEVGQTLQSGDLITTGPETWVQLLFVPACQVWLAPAGQVLVGNLRSEEENIGLELMLGRLRTTFGSLLGDLEERFSITAESVFAAPRGTDFTVERLSTGALLVQVVEGEVAVGNRGGEGLRLPVGRAVEVQLQGALSPVSRPLKLEPERWSPPASVKLGRSDLPLTLPTPVSPLPGAAQTELPLTPPLPLPPAQPWTVELKP